MAMVIQHNIPALQSYNIVNNTSNQLQKAIQKLSSGLRINSAADDAAGLAISEKMRAQVRGLDKAVSNAQDGISLIQTAEGALGETHSILQRMRELSVQAANDTLTQQDRSYIQVEIDQLRDEVTRIGNTTQFNKKKLLNGDSSALWSSDNNETKAIINGGLREIDQFGQKKSVEGNYKIKVKADPGQGEVQKSDIMKVKHADVLMNKSTSIQSGVTDVNVTNAPAGNYQVKLTAAADAGGSVLTGAYGIGGTKYSATSQIDFNTITSPVTKISVQTTDGTEIWSTSGSDLFKQGTKQATAADQAKFFEGSDTATTYNVSFTGVQDEITAAARAKGITLTGWGDGSAATMNLTATKMNGEAPGIKIVYETTGEAPSPSTSSVSSQTTTEVKAEDVFDVSVEDKAFENGSVLFEVQSINQLTNEVTLKATGSVMSADGTNHTAVQENIVLNGGDNANTVYLTNIFGGDSDQNKTVSIKLQDLDAVQEGGKFVYFITPNTDANSNANPIGIQVHASLDSSWEDKWDGGPYNGEDLNYVLNGEKTASKDIHFKSYVLNGKTGVASESDIILSTNTDFRSSNVTGGKLDTSNEKTLASFDAAYIGKVADGSVKLRDLDKFWDNQGVFMLEDAKTITLNQGDGKTASVTLYANDTLDDVAKKMNDAIANGLGQAKYVDDATKFVTYVGNGSTTDSEAVDGTFLMRSVVPGAGGEISFSGDENLINAFSLNTIQESKETTYSVDVSDAHTGEVIAQNVKTTGNVLHGVINPNVDVEFSALSGIAASWDDNSKKFRYASSTQETTLHLADNTTVFQIGANEGEDMGINIGDMRSHALGLDSVNVMSRDRASRSITIIDNAIDKVSTQRAKIGAYQNRLEYTVNNLTTASENLTSAESRIRDADMAKEMMNFTKLNIMLQAGNSMLAQANQQPQNVLSLIR